MKLTDILGRFFGGAPSGLRNKPGGMAWINTRREPELRGRIVKTVRADRDGFWRIEPEQPFVASVFNIARFGVRVDRGQQAITVAAHDDVLVPIGSPGEDARDETLLWLAVPTTKETA